MTKPSVIQPASGSRVVTGASDVVLFGQPPEVLKALLLNNVSSFNAIVLTDIREKGGSLTNNLEFPLYFYLFLTDAFAKGQRMFLVGEEVDISHAIRLLRFTLTGPVESELSSWGTKPELKKEWLQVAEALAYKNAENEVVEIEDFFDIRPFENGKVQLPELTLHHTGRDQYEVANAAGSLLVDLAQDEILDPPYTVQKDYVPGGLVKLGLEVLGGASGFTPNEPCTGLALCHNGDYILIDAMPFLDQHLVARGISKNQISAIFLTHLHDDHCTMFPLMLMPHVVEVITTQEIFNMAMEKLSCGLGWTVEAVQQHFSLFEIEPNVPVNYYGLTIEPHLTVHSIPTIGATFSTFHHGHPRQICIIGDNHSMSAINDLESKGLVRAQTVDTLKNLYENRFSLLVADGGAGAIHGDPADAIKSQSERVVYVHVEELANEFDTTFSLAVSGKRYTIIEGDPVLYGSQINHYLSKWLDERLSNRWLRSLLAESEIRSYNGDDVILVQDAASQDFVYLLLTGYCEVVQHDGKKLKSVAHLQAGDVIGEMATITGKGARNASVVARTPTTVCVFSEKTFSAFIAAQGLGERLLERWSIRPLISSLPCFSKLTSIVLLQTSIITSRISLGAGEKMSLGEEGWYVLIRGTLRDDKKRKYRYQPSKLTEFGWLPFSGISEINVEASEDAEFLYFERLQLEARLLAVPQLNYYIRKYRVENAPQTTAWQLGMVAPR